jgi:hypothetical protein
MIFTVRKGCSLATNPTLSRRRALRLAAVPAVQLAGEVPAGRTWCRFDPTVSIDGQIVHLWVSGLLDEHYDVAGSTQVVFRIPPGVQHELLAQDASFGLGYGISFQEDRKLKATGKIEITAEVYVPATRTDKNQPILVEWIPDGTVKTSDARQGKIDTWITAATKLKRRK